MTGDVYFRGQFNPPNGGTPMSEPDATELAKAAQRQLSELDARVSGELEDLHARVDGMDTSLALVTVCLLCGCALFWLMDRRMNG